MIEYKRVGGLHFLRIGRVGGSVYIAKRKPARVCDDAEAERITARLNAIAILGGVAMASALPALILAMGR